jgi:hypothetical protein
MLYVVEIGRAFLPRLILLEWFGEYAIASVQTLKNDRDKITQSKYRVFAIVFLVAWVLLS